MLEPANPRLVLIVEYAMCFSQGKRFHCAMFINVNSDSNPLNVLNSLVPTSIWDLFHPMFFQMSNSCFHPKTAFS